MALKQRKSVHLLQTCNMAVQEDWNAARDNADCSFDSGKFIVLHSLVKIISESLFAPQQTIK